MAKREHSSIVQRVRLYEAAKAIYDVKPNIRPVELLREALAAIPKDLRPKHQDGSAATNMMLWLRAQPTKSEGNRLAWHPCEWSIVLREYQRLVAEHPQMKHIVQIEKAISLLPKGRRRDPRIAGNFATQMRAHAADLGPLPQKPSLDNPYPFPPGTQPKEQQAQPEAPPEAPKESTPEQPDTPISELGGMVFSLLGTAFNAAVDRAATIIGDKLGEQIGEKVAASVQQALYDMRLGLLSSKRVSDTTQVTPVEKPAPTLTPAEARMGDLPARFFRPKCMVVGLLPGQEQIVKNLHTHIDFRFLSPDLPGERIKSVAENCDACYVIIKFVGHSVTESLRKPNGPGYVAIKGVIDALNIRLGDDWPKDGVRSDVRRQTAAYAPH